MAVDDNAVRTGCGGGHYGSAIVQRQQIGRAYRYLPCTVCCNLANIALSVQRYGYDGTDRQPGAVAVDHQIAVRLIKIQVVIAGDNADRHRINGGIHGKGVINRGRLAVTIGHANVQGVGAVRELLQLHGRESDAPAAARIHTALIAARTESNGNYATRLGIGYRSLEDLIDPELCRIQIVTVGQRLDVKSR